MILIPWTKIRISDTPPSPDFKDLGICEKNMKEYVGNMKEYVENTKEYVENMKEYEGICGKYERICHVELPQGFSI